MVCCCYTVPQSLRDWVHPHLGFSSLQRIFSIQTRSACGHAQHLLRFFSSSRHRHSEFTGGMHPKHCLRSTLSVPPALDGFLLPVLCEFVSPHNRVQDSPFRGFPRYRANTPRRCTFPPDVSKVLLLSSCLDRSRWPSFVFRALIPATIRNHYQVC